MSTRQIETLLSGPLDPGIELDAAMQFPIELVRIAPSSHHAPDYRLDAGGRTGLGYGWRRTSPRGHIPYLDVIIERPGGARLSGVAWQAPDDEGRWFIQLQEAAAMTPDA